MAPPQPPLLHEGRGGLQAAIPTVGGELRIVVEGTACELQAWSCYSGGQMMAGGLRLDAQTLRVALHALRCALHAVERAEVDIVRRAAA